MRVQSYSILAIVALAVVAGPAAVAQTQRSGGSGGESARIMQQYQQLAGEKTALQGQVAQMKSELDAAKTELAAVKKERDVLKKSRGGGASPAAVAQLASSKASVEKELDVSKQRLTELVSRFRETATNLKDVEAEKTKLARERDERNALFDKCAENNLQLYEITGDVLKRYENVGVFTKASASEPFTRLTRTRIENLVDEYRAKALELRSKQRAATAAPAATPPKP